MDITRTKRPDSWRREFIAQNGARCHYCNRPSSLDIGPGGRPWHIDHMDPISRGGEDVEENLALSCKRCNLVKASRPYKQFKKLARNMFWQPDDGVSEGELETLLDLWSAAFDGDGKYFVSDIRPDAAKLLRDDLGNVGTDNLRIHALTRGDLSGDEEQMLATMRPDFSASRREEAALLDLLVKSHELIPRLIAEVRMARADAQEEAA